MEFIEYTYQQLCISCW